MLVLGPVPVGGSGCHDISVDVPARSEGGAHGLDDRAEHGFEVLLEDAVQLVGLPRREAQRAVAKLQSQLQPLTQALTLRDKRSETKSDETRFNAPACTSEVVCMHAGAARGCVSKFEQAHAAGRLFGKTRWCKQAVP